MNYLQMYVNLVWMLIFVSTMSWIASIVIDEASKRARTASLVIATVTTALTIFCAAMAGLLS